MIDYDEDYEHDKESPFEAVTLPGKLVAIAPALYDPPCPTNFAGCSRMPFSSYALP